MVQFGTDHPSLPRSRLDLKSSPKRKVAQLGRGLAFCWGMVARGTYLRILLTLLALSVSCGINPVPEPPSSNPIEPPKVELVTLAPDPMMADTDIDVAGAPGSAEPGAELWVVNIDGTEPPTTTEVQPDGSFALVVQGFANDELRLQLRQGSLRSEPIVPAQPGPAVISVRALSDCILLDPPQELILPKPSSPEPPSASIRIENTCAMDVDITDLRLRLASSALSAELRDASPPDVVPANGTREILVRAYGDPAEEILLVEFSSAQQDRRPITLVSQGGVSGLEPACEQVGGTCMSDPMDVGFPADCEELGQQTMQAWCEAFNHACCKAL